MNTCDCGKPVTHPRTGECGACYQRRWYHENRSPKRFGGETRTYPLDTVGYQGAHKRVAAARGRAAEHTCARCFRDAEEWSYTPGSPVEQTGHVTHSGRNGKVSVTFMRWSPDPVDYEPLCKPCHELKDHT